jgi:Zn-dependent protease with chaperone function
MDMREAAAGLHGRAVLLVSQGALRLLEAEELQAVVAHEIGHEYVWDHYAAAVSRGDMARVRDLELACDAIAVLTLGRAGIDPKRLISAVEKVYRFNSLRFRSRDESRHPTLQQRRELIERVAGGR